MTAVQRWLTTHGNARLALRALALAIVLGWAAVPPSSARATSGGGVIISEFLASNSNGLTDEDGDTPDWIELYNAGDTTVDLAGWHLTDSAGNLTQWTFPTVLLPPKGFLVVFASGKDRAVAGGELHANFRLDAEGEFLALVQPDGVTVASQFAPQFPEQFGNIAYGLAQQITTNRLAGADQPVRVFVPVSGALGLAWTAPDFADGGWWAGTNGVGYEAAVPGFAVRNFKANVVVDNVTKAETVIATPAQQSGLVAENRSVLNCLNTGNAGHYGGDEGFPGFPIGSDRDDFVIEATAVVTIPAAGNWTFGVSSDDGFKLEVGGFALSFPSGRSPSDSLGTFNFPAAGDYPLRLVYFERAGGAELELFAAPGSYGLWSPVGFRLVGDVAGGGLAVRSAPLSGTASLSYRGAIRTDVQALMLGRSPSAYVRLPFTLTNTGLESLRLQVQYDDGFVAYLNGEEVARRNAPAVVEWNSTALIPRPNTLALITEEINLSDRLPLLRAGLNVLALHGLNDRADSTDFLIVAGLVEHRVAPVGQEYFATPSPGTFNGEGLLAFVADTRFSHDRGFYDAPFSCVITSATPGAVIRYTLNGSTPDLTNGFTYAAPIAISNTTILRAAAFKEGFQPSNVDTHTYLFLDDVIRQSPLGQAPGPDWPPPRTSGGQVYDYGMDPDIVNSPAYGGLVKDALKAIPTFSIVTDAQHLFDPATGIYANPSGDELAWERPTSLELVRPDGREGFQIDCGLRLRGGFSRSPNNPKHAFRLFFRQAYGAGRLNYPLFGDNGADSFDKFDLRTMQNYSWSFLADPRMIAIRDAFARDTQRDMGQPHTRGDFYHLYVNGQYWGLYQIQERSEAAYGESYFGGREEDYDTIKPDADSSHNIEATDGDLEAWFRLWQAATNGFAGDAAYERVQGNDPDGTRNPAYENLVEVDNLIDYMLLVFFTGNLDAPISQFGGNAIPNNYFALRNRAGTAGFRFFAHDSEHTLLLESTFSNDELHRDRTGPFAAGDPAQGSGFLQSNPQYLWQRLTANAEFRVRAGDRIQRHFFNGGALTVEACQARFLARSNEIQLAVVAESARWGDAKRATPLTRADWVTEMRRIYGTYLGQRSAIVLEQLRGKGLYPGVAAPAFNQYGGLVAPGFQLFMTNGNPGGTIYYTLDGSDPRRRGGGIASNAVAYAAPLTLNAHTAVRARVFFTNAWSALVEATFYTLQDFTQLQVTEIMYHPPDQDGVVGDEFEFLELKNAGLAALDLSGLTFTSGINFTFTNGTRLEPGGFLVLAASAERLAAKYPGLAFHGVYGGQLNNGGEPLTLSHPLGGAVLSFAYDDEAPWPVTPDGHGFSLVPQEAAPFSHPGRAGHWRASAQAGGSPGADDPPSGIPRVLVNEVITQTILPELDAVELFNPNAFAVDLGGWFLTDDPGIPKKYRIPAGTTIDGDGYLVFDESHFNAVPGASNSFSLSALGEFIFLFSGDANTNLTGYSHGFEFGAGPPGGSFGRHVDSRGEEHLVAQVNRTLYAPNAGPRVGPVVITEIMYHPPDLPGGVDNEENEYLKLANVTGEPVTCFDPAAPTNTWQLRGAVDFEFPPGFVLGAGESVVVVGFDPNDPGLAAAFRHRHGLLAGLRLLGPYRRRLDNSSDRVELYRPESSPAGGAVPYVLVDAVRYADVQPWPPAADGSGASLHRLDGGAFGDDPANWIARVPLTVLAQPPSFTARIGTNLVFTVTALGEGPLRYQWFHNGGELPGATNVSLAVSNVQLTAGGEYRVRITDDFGSAFSAPGVLTVLFNPVIVEQPLGRIVAAGETVSFTVAVTNAATLPVRYRWRKFGQTINSANFLLAEHRSNFTLPDVVPTNAGTYSVVVTNSVFPLGYQSSNAYLAVVVPPADQAVPVGANAMFQVQATGPGPNGTGRIHYQWHFNDAELAGETNATLAVPNVQPGHDGTYAVVVTLVTNAVISPATFAASLRVQLPDADGDGMPDDWELAYGFLPGNPADGALDADGDGLSNRDEYLAGTDPRDEASALRLDAAAAGAAGGVVLGFEAVSNRSYTIQFRDAVAGGAWSNLANVSPASASRPMAVTNVPPAGVAERFYRLVTPRVP